MEIEDAPALRPISTYASGPPPHDSPFGTDPVGDPAHHQPRELVRVERDYSIGEVTQFFPSMPPELEGRLSAVEFSETINDINALLLSAQARGWALLDNILMITTFFLSPYILGTHYHRKMNKLASYLDQVNTKLFRPAGLNLVDPIKTAYLFLELEYY